MSKSYTNILEVENLCKSYPEFELKNVSFSLPKGYIMGFIGANGSGKSTTLKSILNIVKPSSGKVEFFGKDINLFEKEIKQNISFTLGAFEYYPYTKVKTIAKVCSKFYDKWSDDVFYDYLKKFDIDCEKTVRKLSTGMKVKFAIALAMSHDSDLFIFDEPTSGLDPIARDELLNIFRTIVEDGEKSILYSTHITSDLEKCADYITFIDNGEIVLSDTIDEIRDNYIVISGDSEMLTEVVKKQAVGYKSNSYGSSMLIEKAKLQDINLKDDAFQNTARPTIEDIMIYFNLGAKNESTTL